MSKRNEIKGKEFSSLKALEKELLSGDYRDYYTGKVLNADEVKAMVKDAHADSKAWFKKVKSVNSNDLKAVEMWTINNICDWVRFPASQFNVTTFAVARMSRPQLYFTLVSYTN